MTYTSDIRKAPEHWRVGELLQHSGLGFSPDERQRLVAAGLLLCNGTPGALDAPFADTDQFTIEGVDYRLDPSQRRPQLVAAAPLPAEPVAQAVRIHAGLHKCLTMYTRRVYEKLCKTGRGSDSSFRHYYHRADHCYRTAARHTVASISGHAIDLARFRNVRVVRFIRDPRDLLVSGYFYHVRAKEPWCELESPADSDFAVVNGCVPAALRPGESLASYLRRVPMSEGLLAEIEFRRCHFDSMRQWQDDPRIRVYRYENILGNEAATFADIARFLELPWRARLNARRYANRFRVGQKKAQHQHIRNPAAGQWQRYFTPAVERAFADAYGDLLRRYGYQ